MKALPFTIPAVENTSFLIQKDKLEGFYPFLHRHEEVQICWIKKGKGTLIVQADVHEFNENDIFVIASNKAHLFKNEITSAGIESISLFFGLDHQKNLVGNIPELKKTFNFYKRIIPCNKLEGKHLIETRHNLESLIEAESESQFLIFLKILISLKQDLQIENTKMSPYSEKDGARMKKIMSYTLENFKNDIYITCVSKQIAYTPEAFCRFFKKRTNKTYIQYLNELRISEACRLILNQEQSDISKVAFECGFNNVSHFNRVFKKMKGNSPLKFRSHLNSGI